METFTAEYIKILKDRSHLAQNGQCRLWNRHPRPGRQYCEINVRFPAAQKFRKINVARLSLMLKLNAVDLPSNLDSSHLCSNPTCINPEHLTIEPHSTNNNRIACFERGVCSWLHEAACLIALKLLVCKTAPLIVFIDYYFTIFNINVEKGTHPHTHKHQIAQFQLETGPWAQ